MWLSAFFFSGSPKHGTFSPNDFLIFSLKRDQWTLCASLKLKDPAIKVKTFSNKTVVFLLQNKCSCQCIKFIISSEDSRYINRKKNCTYGNCQKNFVNANLRIFPPSIAEMWDVHLSFSVRFAIQITVPRSTELFCFNVSNIYFKLKNTKLPLTKLGKIMNSRLISWGRTYDVHVKVPFSRNL